MEMPLLHTGYVRKDIFHHILHMVHPDNIIDIIIIHHDTGIFFLRRDIFDFLQSCIHGNSNNIGSMGGNLPCGAVAQLKDIVKHLLHVFINRTAVAACVHHLTDFLLRHIFFFFLYAIPPNQHQRNDVEQTGKYQTYISLQGHPPFKKISYPFLFYSLMKKHPAVKYSGNSLPVPSIFIDKCIFSTV